MRTPDVSVSRRMVLGLLGSSMLPAAEEFAGQLENLVLPLGGELGFSLLHVESGERISIRGGERFAMASIYKLPIAIAVLDAVDKGTLSASQVMRLKPEDLRLGLGTDEVARLVGNNGYDFRLDELLRRMLVDSDNAASDALLGLVGAAAVTNRMAALGVPAIRVDRPELHLLLDFVGASTAEPTGGWSVEQIRQRYRSANSAQRRAALAAFCADPRDTATPDAMVELLFKVHRGEVLQPASGRLLLEYLEQCATGPNRLRGKLPADARFLHRTGTTDSTDGVTAGTNDVGILHLPKRGGTVILAAFLRGSRGGMAERAAVLASIGRAVALRYSGM